MYAREAGIFFLFCAWDFIWIEYLGYFFGSIKGFHMFTPATVLYNRPSLVHNVTGMYECNDFSLRRHMAEQQK